MVSQLRRRDASPSLVLLVVCAGVVLASLDLFIVNVALPEMARDLDAPLSSLSWVLNGYAIAFASLLVLFGRLAERRSRELGFLVGVLVFTLASAACGLATSVEALVAFRVVQGAGAALLTPASLSLVLATAPDERRHSSVRAWTAVGGLAAALGPVVGGLLVAADWRWVFLVNVPIGLAALYVGWRRLPHVPGHPVPRPDALGAGLLSAGVAGLTLALVRGEDWGWGSTATLATLGISVALLSVFVGHCLRARNPLVEPALFRAGGFAGSSIVMTLFSVSFGAMLLSLVLWMQDVWGWSALATGLAVAPGPLMVPLFSFLVAGRLIARFGPAPVVTAGMTIFAAGPRLVGGRRAGRAGLRRHPPRRDAPDGHRRRADAADAHGHGGGVAAAPGVRHRIGRGQHAAPGRPRARRGAARRAARHAGVERCGADGVPDRLARARGDRARRGRRRCRPASDEGGGPRGGDPHCGTGCTRHAVATVTA